jgi:ribosomal protein S12 methylthiotransferase accessory factor
MRMEIRFPGGAAVDAAYDGFVISTDQPVGLGGTGSAPSPFDLFLASIGTCAGLYALRFCQRRGIGTDGLAVTLTGESQEHDRVSLLRLEIRLPEGFPDKYKNAIGRAVDQCKVKQHILNPPVFEVSVTDSPARASLASTA